MPVETKVPGAYPEGKKAEDPQTGDEKIISEVRNLKEAYILYSPLTNMPYVECEEENYNDQIRLYQKKTEAEEAGKELEEKGIRTGESGQTGWREETALSESGTAAAEYPAFYRSKCGVL